MCIKRKDDMRNKHPAMADNNGVIGQVGVAPGQLGIQPGMPIVQGGLCSTMGGANDAPTPKKPRLVFTDIQRRTLLAIFKVTTTFNTYHPFHYCSISLVICVKIT